ncbi:arginine/serine-rich coiled-coil protein 2-like, partial [Bombyx mandarina]|uniref:Arginine/serine-rich coiled-coil protein 2-like n=1 Tax=Bombyx mandarina TaxID=7092 RepID=A0A6J2JZZ3_BOMMA
LASAAMGRSEEMEPEEEKKKLNEEFVEFIRKRSETDAPRYTARLKTYVDFQRKRDRATAARRNHTTGHHDKIMAAKKKPDDEQKDKGLENADHISGDNERLSRRPLSSSDGTSEGSFRPLKPRSGTTDEELDPFSIEPFVATEFGLGKIRDGDKCSRARSMSRSRSGEPLDRCGRRRKKRRRSCRRRRRRRRRSCRRRRRRRRSCRRRRSRRRRRRSCCRRRRRRRRRRC